MFRISKIIPSCFSNSRADNVKKVVGCRPVKNFVEDYQFVFISTTFHESENVRPRYLWVGVS